MASFWTNRAATELMQGTLDLDTDVLKVMLLDDSVTPTQDMDFVSEIAADEIAVTGYTGGFGGAGRKVLAGITVVENDAGNQPYAVLPDQTWTALGAGASVEYAAVIREGTSDADSLIVGFIDVRTGGTTPVATNGGDVTLDFAAASPLYLNTGA